MKHILFIFCDQLRYDCIGALGNPFIQTPALDSLAKDAVCFDRCITPAPVCVPARLSMFSGQYSARTGNSNNNKKMSYNGEGFYSLLTKNGFKSCCVGKMHHVWDPYAPMGFSERHTQEEMSKNEDDYTNFIKNGPYSYVFDYNGQRSEMYYVPQISQLPAEAHPTQWIGDNSVEFLDRCNPEDENIFLMSSFIHPHPPFCPPSPWNKLYRSYDVIPPHIPENYDYNKYAPIMHTKFSTKSLDISNLDVLRLRNYYYGCVSFVDYQVGRIIKKLKEKGMYDDTLIVLSADHGEMLGDFGNMGKRCMLQPAAHIPLIMKVPGKSHEIRHDVCSLVDIAPTFLSFAGIPYDKNEYDGIDLFSDKKHDVVYSQYNCNSNGVYMVAGEKDKLVWSGKNKQYYYFADENEENFSSCESNPRVLYLKEKLDAYVASDCGIETTGKAAGARESAPFMVSFMDHNLRHEEEIARVPSEYKLYFTMHEEI